MPSSLRGVHSRALVCSTHPPVSVCGTGDWGKGREAFLGARGQRIRPGPVGPSVRRPVAAGGCPFRSAALQPFNKRVPPRLWTPAGAGMLTRSAPSRQPLGWALRPRLTLGGRTLPRNPGVYGGRDSHPANRYSCLHPHLGRLHRGSPPGFCAPKPNAPLPGARPVGPGAPKASVGRLELPIIVGAESLDESAITHCLNGGCL